MVAISWLQGPSHPALQQSASKQAAVLMDSHPTVRAADTLRHVDMRILGFEFHNSSKLSPCKAARL